MVNDKMVRVNPLLDLPIPGAGLPERRCMPVHGISKAMCSWDILPVRYNESDSYNSKFRLALIRDQRRTANRYTNSFIINDCNSDGSDFPPNNPTIGMFATQLRYPHSADLHDGPLDIFGSTITALLVELGYTNALARHCLSSAVLLMPGQLEDSVADTIA